MIKKIAMIVAVVALFAGIVQAHEIIHKHSGIEKTVTIFYSPYCPHCHHLLDFVDSTLEKKYPNVKFDLIDTSKVDNTEIWNSFKKAANFPVEKRGVPMTFIGNELVLGFGTPETTGAQIIELIEK